MELTNPEVIAQLLAEQQRTPRRARPTPQPSPMAESRPQIRQRCQCGVCAGCRENARWDRIFKEKFADPDYYSGVAVKFSSSLRFQ
jgi:hypothetical protein